MREFNVRPDNYFVKTTPSVETLAQNDESKLCCVFLYFYILPQTLSINKTKNLCAPEKSTLIYAREMTILPNKVSIFMVQILDDEARAAQPLWRNAILHARWYFCFHHHRKKHRKHDGKQLL